MGKNPPNDPVVIDQTDLATLLGCLASDLRNAGQAVRMMGTELASSGERTLADADRLAGSLDRVAEILNGLGDHVCKDCQILSISEQIQVGVPSRLSAK